MVTVGVARAKRGAWRRRGGAIAGRGEIWYKECLEREEGGMEAVEDETASQSRQPLRLRERQVSKRGGECERTRARVGGFRGRFYGCPASRPILPGLPLHGAQGGGRPESRCCMDDGAAAEAKSKCARRSPPAHFPLSHLLLVPHQCYRCRASEARRAKCRGVESLPKPA